MPENNCCAKCARRSECLKKPRSKYFCTASFGGPGCAAFRCRPLRCFRSGVRDVKGQTKMWES